MDIDGPSFRLLRANRLFAGMTDTAIAECAKQFTLLHARRGQQLFCQGDACNQVYFLLRGCVRVARLAEDGSEFTIRLVGCDQVFGEDSIFDKAAFSSTATPLSDGITAVCCVTRMKALLMRHPLLSMNIAQCLREDHERTLNRLEQISHKPVRERLLTLLKELAPHYGTGEMQGGAYEVKLTHAEIASLIGSTRETVSSELSKLARAGVVSRRRRKIVINAAIEEAA